MSLTLTFDKHDVLDLSGACCTATTYRQDADDTFVEVGNDLGSVGDIISQSDFDRGWIFWCADVTSALLATKILLAAGGRAHLLRVMDYVPPAPHQVSALGADANLADWKARHAAVMANGSMRTPHEFAVLSDWNIEDEMTTVAAV